MKYSQELSKLIIQNIEQHEKACLILEEIDTTLMKAIETEAKTIIEQSAPELDGNQEFDFSDTENFKFSFKDWKVEEISESVFFSKLTSYSENDEDTETWLGFLCGIPYQSTGLSIKFSADYRALSLKANRYKQLLRETLELSQTLIKCGFKLSESGYGLELVFKLNKDKILASYPKNLSEAMTPLTHALEIFIECKPEFDLIVEKLKEG